ncbi:hypothetical protein [Hymenobacter fodinae]|uniref:Uncharacterized protein n=1 Tax=Hymenobacter fodinae TaxID=2510796 RepID=A0A4Z0P0U5_9BACT|nr:hypothetical protein [Hymenobacter fodinae]TGE04776.1 hypothetical protein EU556_21585 [Hymenobacter fodinae]
MKKLFYMVGCLLVLSSSPVMAVVGDPAVVVVRVSEHAGGISIAISKGAGPAEMARFDNGDNDKYLTRAADGYQKVIANLYAQGYVLQSTVQGYQDPSIKSYSTLIFIKAPKP